MATVRVGDQELYHDRRGSGEPVLMIMGIAATSDYWGSAFLEVLAQRFELITYDHRGIGRSARVAVDFTIGELADDAEGLLAALEIESAHVLGFSLGGMVAQALALRRPTAVRRLVLGGTACNGRSALSSATLGKLERAMVSSDPEAALQAGLEANVSPAGATNPELRAAWVRMVTQTRLPLRTVQRQLDALRAHDSADRVAAIAAPTLVVHGAEDQLVEPSHGLALADALPNATLVQMPRTGHMFFWERPALSGDVIGGWLAGEDPSARNQVEVRNVVRK